MNVQLLARSNAVRAAAAVLLLCLVASARMVVSTLRTEPVSLSAPAVAAQLSAASNSNRLSANIEDAIDNDLFSPTHTPPAHAFRMPGEPLATDSAKEEAKPVVLGTAVSADGSSFATCEVGADAPRIVRVGDRLGGYVVKSIDRGKVAFQRAGGSRVDVVAQRP